MLPWIGGFLLLFISQTLTYGDEEIKTTLDSEAKLNQDKDNGDQTDSEKQKILNPDLQSVEDLKNKTNQAESNQTKISVSETIKADNNSIFNQSNTAEIAKSVRRITDETANVSNEGNIYHNSNATLAAGLVSKQTRLSNESEINEQLFKTEENKDNPNKTYETEIQPQDTKIIQEANSKITSKHVLKLELNNDNEALKEEFVKNPQKKIMSSLSEIDKETNKKVGVENSKVKVDMNRESLALSQKVYEAPEIRFLDDGSENKNDGGENPEELIQKVTANIIRNDNNANEFPSEKLSKLKSFIDDENGITDYHGDLRTYNKNTFKPLHQFKKPKTFVSGLGKRNSQYTKHFVKPRRHLPKYMKKEDSKYNNVTNNADEDRKFETLKKDLIESIMNKTSALVIKITKSRHPSDVEKERVLEIIKAKVLKKVSPLSDRYKLWTDVITKGVDATFLKIRLQKGFQKVYRRNGNSNTKLQVTEKEPVLIATFDPLAKRLNSSPHIPCGVLIQKACTNINGLNSLPCENGNRSVTMEKLCDGIYDCNDGSDEMNCSDKAIKKLKLTEILVDKAESHKLIDCLKYDDTYLSKKKRESLKKVIANQVALIAHCIDSPLVKTSLKRPIRDRVILEHAANQIATVISSVSTSLDAAICSEQIKHFEDFDNVIKRIDEHDEHIIEVVDDKNSEEWQFRFCKCSGRVCMPHPCNEKCQKICEHKHALRRMMCRSFNGETSISLDLICDGKIDCEDESDENNCNEDNTYARFEGFNAFGRVSQVIQAKIQSKYYSAVRSNLFSLHKVVTQLQKLNANLAVNKHEIKLARNRAFELLGSVYVDMLTKVEKFNETEKIFDFLMTIHDELIRALKHCHTGNDRLVPSEDCSCRETVCNVPFCPSYCVRACAVEPSFMQLTCKDYPGKKVALRNICDGTKDCPLGDDEKLCDHDTCRKHHFLLLHTTLDKEISTGKGQNLLGEILKAWKKKAILTAKTAEVAVVPSRDNFKQIVSKLLHELVMAFSFTEEIKGDPTELYNTFYSLSQQVIKLVNYCGTY